MNKIFINYRSRDEHSSAVLIAKELGRRFGKEEVFLDGSSIAGGADFTKALCTGVRQCSVLLVVMGDAWLNARGKHGGRALDDEDDWTRREIVEALDCGVVTIPVLIGRKMDPVSKESLPDALAELANCQVRRLDLHDPDAGLTRLGNTLAELVPQLTDRLTHDQQKEPSAGTVQNRVGEVSGPVTQNHDYIQHDGIGSVGSIGSFIKDSQGPVNTGTGPQYNAPQISGERVNFNAGNQSGTVDQSVDNAPREDDTQPGGGE